MRAERIVGKEYDGGRKGRARQEEALGVVPFDGDIVDFECDHANEATRKLENVSACQRSSLGSVPWSASLPTLRICD